jgi:hypothetical protein
MRSYSSQQNVRQELSQGHNHSSPNLHAIKIHSRPKLVPHHELRLEKQTNHKSREYGDPCASYLTQGNCSSKYCHTTCFLAHAVT